MGQNLFFSLTHLFVHLVIPLKGKFVAEMTVLISPVKILFRNSYN